MVLTADKGVSMVVMDKDDYNSQIRRIALYINIPDPENRSHKQTQEQADIPAENNQGRRWDS